MRLLPILFLFISFTALGQRTLFDTAPDESYRNGIELFEKKKYAAAQESFEKFMAKELHDERTIESEYYYAYCALELFQPAAEELFKEFVDAHPYHPKALLAFYDLGNFYYTQKKYEKAIFYLLKTDLELLDEEKSKEASFKLGYSLFVNKAYDEALPHFERAMVGNHSYRYASHYYAGYINFRNGEYDKAYNQLQFAGNDKGYEPIVPYMILSVLYKKGEYDRVIKEGNEYLKRENVKSKEDISLLVAEAYFKAGEYSTSAKYFKTYFDKNSRESRPELLYRYAFALFTSGEYANVKVQLNKIKNAPDSLQGYVWFYLGQSQVQTGEKQFALNSFRSVLNYEVEDKVKKEALFYLGKISYELESYEACIETFEQLNRQYPKHKYSNVVNELLSEAYLNTRNYARALAYVDSIPEKNTHVKKTDQLVSFYYGALLFNKGNFQEALTYYNRSLNYDYDKEVQVASSYWKGEVLSIEKQWEAAKNPYAFVFRNAEPTSEYYINSRFGIGYAYFNTEKYDDALRHFKAFVEAKPKNKAYVNDALVRIGDCYYKLKSEPNHYQKAIDNYAAAILENVPNRDYAYYQTGKILGGPLNDQYQGIKNLNLLIKLHPKSPYVDDALFEKGKIKLENNRSEEAIADFDALINQYPKSNYVPEAHYNVGLAYINSKQYQKAVERFDLILNDYCQSEYAGKALSELRVCYDKLGKPEAHKDKIDKFTACNEDPEVVAAIKYKTVKSDFYDGKYTQALSGAKDFLKNYNSSTSRTEMKYYIAESYYQLDSLSKASEAFEVLLSNNFQEWYNISLERLAEIKQKEGKNTEAIALYKKLLPSSTTKRKQLTALEGLQINYYTAKQYDSSIYYGKEIVQRLNSVIDARNKAQLRIGRAYYAKGDSAVAIEELTVLADKEKDIYSAEANYLIAKILREQGKNDQSLERLKKTVKEYSEFKQWWGESYLLIAENLVDKGKEKQAIAVLESMNEFPIKDIKQRAEKRKQELMPPQEPVPEVEIIDLEGKEADDEL